MGTREKGLIETKDMIIQSAIEVISQKGYSKTTLEDIVQNIGLTRGAFYWHFKDKSEILDEILQQYEAYYADLYQIESLDSAYETIRNTVVNNLRSKFEQKNRLSYLVRYHIEAYTDMNRLIYRQRDLDEKIIKQLSNEVSRGIRQGEFDAAIDADAIALYILTNLIGFDNYIMLHNNEKFIDPRVSTIDIETYADFILKVLK